MSLITRCPACSTMFKLVTDQLRVSGGWVRCGRCNEVFDAATHLVPYKESIEASRRQSQPVPPPAPVVAPTPSAPEPTASAPDVLQPDATPAPAQPTAPASVAEEPAPLIADVPAEVPAEPAEVPAVPPSSDAAPRPRATFVPWTASELQAWREARAERERAAQSATEAADAPLETAASATAASAAGAPTSTTGAADQAQAPASEEPSLTDTDRGDAAVDFVLSDMGRTDAPDQAAAGTPLPEAVGADAELSQLSFVAAAKRRAFWSSRPMRATLWSVALLLTLALVAQFMVTRRDALAARHPDWVPALQTLCLPLGCRIQPYRQLDAVVIDSSAFQRTSGAVFRFSVSLRNQLDMPIATPALELTLTDASEQPVARRVLAATEIGAPAAIAARGEFSGTNTVTVSAPSDPSAVTGYRLVAFYP